jgi:DNA-binding transcriptional regulator YiaG
MEWNKDTIKALRKHIGVNQTELAFMMGSGSYQQTISRWERGTHAPSKMACFILDAVAKDALFHLDKR